jgi:hypothetical protein
MVGWGGPDDAEVVVERRSTLKPARSTQKCLKRSTAATGTTTTSSFVCTRALLGDADLTSIERSRQRSLVLNHQS